jgi:hypothetical protein
MSLRLNWWRWRELNSNSILSHKVQSLVVGSASLEGPSSVELVVLHCNDLRDCLLHGGDSNSWKLVVNRCSPRQHIWSSEVLDLGYLA